MKKSNLLKGYFLQLTVSSILIGVILCFAFFVIQFSIVYAADTGWKSPDRDGDVYGDWSTASDADTSDDDWARGEPDKAEEQDYYVFSFGIPVGATIDGIEVMTEAHINEAGSTDGSVKLSWDSGASWTATKNKTFTSDTVDEFQTYGGSTDTWGRAWSRDDFFNAHFRVYIQPINANPANNDLHLDHIQVKVHYTPLPNQAPGIPTLNSPSDGSSGISITPDLKFDYSDPNSNSCTKFDLLLDNNSDFSSPEINETNYSTGSLWADGSTITYTVGSSLPYTTQYFWKVRVYDGQDWSNWSDGSWDFTTRDAGTNQAPNLISCVDGAVTASPSQVVTLTGEWIDPGDTVRLLVSEDSNFTNCNYTTQTGCLAYSTPTAASPATATYTVQAGDGNIVWYAQICDDEGLCDEDVTRTITKQVNAGSDDGDEFEDGQFNITRDYVMAGDIGSLYSHSGFRFPHMEIVQGATIASATLELYSLQWRNSLLLNIYAHDTDDAPTFADAAGQRILNRTTTTAFVAWDDYVFTNGGWGASPQMNNVVQEVISRGGWLPGNDAVVLLKNDGASISQGAFASDENATPAFEPAKLSITYSGQEAGAFSESAAANQAPTAPTELRIRKDIGDTLYNNPSSFDYSTPFFSAVYNDPDSDDGLTKFRIQLTTSGDVSYSSSIWDSGASGTEIYQCMQELHLPPYPYCSEGHRSADIFYSYPSYNGMPILEKGQDYIWRIKFWDRDDSEGGWSENGAINIANGSLTAKFYSGSGDGYIQSAYNAAWDSSHDATSGGAVDDGDWAKVRTAYAFSQYQISRVFLPTNTSALPDDATVSAALLKLRLGTFIGDADNDGDDFIRVVQTSQTSTSGLNNDDYNNCGAVNNPTAGAPDIDLGDLTSSSYNTWTLNSTGIGWISKTGYTKLGLREGHDVVDSAVEDGENSITVHFSEEIGTPAGSALEDMEFDPYFEVTYATVANQAPNIPTLNSPTDGSTGISITPNLKFNYSDGNSDTCTKFDIKVDNDPAFGSPEVNEIDYSTGGPWASGSAITYSVASGLSNSTKYYWKARVYDGTAWSDWADGSWDFTTVGGGGETIIELLTGEPEICWGSGGSNPQDPYNTYYHDSRAQSVYLASDLTAAGMTGPSTITAVHLNCCEVHGRPNLKNFRIRMQHTSDTVSTAWATSGWTLVYGPTDVVTTADEWQTYTLATPFEWDGTSNLLIDFSRDDTGYSAGGGMYTRTGLINRTCAGYSDSDYTWPFDSMSETDYDRVPSIKLTSEVNQSPDLTSCVDGTEATPAGETVTFTGEWTDPSDTVRLLISEDSGFTNCNYTTQTGCLAYSAPTTVSPATATYTVQAGDGDIVWYAQICDDEGLCEENITRTITKQVNAGSDDGDEFQNGTFDITRDHVMIGDIGGLDSHGGFRFSHVEIAQGSTITSALLELYSLQARDALLFNIYAHDTDDAPTFADAAGQKILNRTTTTAFEPWDNYSFSNSGWGTSPDINNIVQEVISRGGWLPGSAVAILVKDDGSSASDHGAFATYENSSPLDPAKLSITYSGQEAGAFSEGGELTPWEGIKLFDRELNQYGHFAEQTPDDGYIMSTADIVIKLNKAGNIEWAKQYQGITGGAIHRTNDNGYIMISGTGDIYVTKIGQAGDLEWIKKYGGDDWESAHSVQQTFDGGYILAGQTNTYGNGDSFTSDTLVIKLDSNGDQIWAKTYGESEQNDGISQIIQLGGGGYIVSGWTTSASVPAGHDHDLFMMELDSSGNQVWAKHYGGFGEGDLGDIDGSYSIAQTLDGGYMIVGKSASFAPGGYYALAIKTDSSGNQVWAKTYGSDRLYSVVATNDGGAAMIGNVSNGTDYFKSSVIKLDSLGNEEWIKTYGSTGHKYNTIQQTSDNGYVLSGFECNPDNSCATFWPTLMKVDSNGNIADCAYIQDANPTIANITMDVGPITFSTHSPTVGVTVPTLTVSSITLDTSDLCPAYDPSDQIPTSPTDLRIRKDVGGTLYDNPVNFDYSTPFFSAVYSDPNLGDTAGHYQIQLTTMDNTSYSSPVWDSGKTNIDFTNCAEGTRCDDIFYSAPKPYGGVPLLERGQSYIWRIKFWDANDNEGLWSGSESIAMKSGALTARFYTGEGDGQVGRIVEDESWDTLHDAAAGITANHTAVTLNVQTSEAQLQSKYYIYKGYFPIDTSRLPDDAIVSVGKLNLWVVTKQEDDVAQDFIRIVQTDQPSISELTLADYNNCGATDNPTPGAADIDIEDITAYFPPTPGHHTEFELNSTGIGWISKTGYTKLGAREEHDCVDVPIADSLVNSIQVFTSEKSGISYDPYLEVTYLESSTNNNPTLTSCDDNMYAATVGQSVTFTGSWTDADAGEQVRLLIMRDSPSGASFDFDTGGPDPKWLTLTHLDGFADDSFDVFINDTKVWHYTDQTSAETWYTSHIPLYVAGDAILTIKIQPTGPKWSGFSTYGQVGVRHVWFRLDDGATSGAVDVSDTIVGEIDIGDVSSESSYNLIGWGPIEPDTHGGSWGNILGDADPDKTCRTVWSSYPTCNYNVQTGCLAYSAIDNSSPTNATYTTQATDGDVRWYARVCDDDNDCSNIKTGIFTVGPACVNHNVYDWAWSGQSEWNTFSCEDTTSSGDYGVDVSDTTGDFSGFSWSEVMGRTTYDHAQDGIPSENGLIGGWSFNENVGSNINDASENGNDGTAVGTSWETGKYNSGLNFNESAYVEIPRSPSLDNIYDQVTLEAWIKPTTPTNTSDWHTIIGKQFNDANGGGFNLATDNDESSVFFHVQTYWLDSGVLHCAYLVVDYAFPEMDKWYHVVGMYDKDTPSMKLYVNGELQDDTPGFSDPDAFGKSIGSTIKNLTIGGDSENNSAAPLGFKGSIDEVRVYNRTLSEEEVEAHYESRAILSTSTMAVSGWARACLKRDNTGNYLCGEASQVEPVMDGNGLIAGYFMNENAGTSIYDSSSFSNDGTFGSDVIWTTGRYNSALYFDGSTDSYVTVADDPSLNVTGAITMEAWVKPDTVVAAGDYRSILNKSQGGSSLPEAGYAMYANEDQTGACFEVDYPSGYLTNCSGDLAKLVPERWNHLVAIYDSSTGDARFYVNGFAVTSGTVFSSIGTTSHPLYIGGNPNPDDQIGLGPYKGITEFQGNIDGVRVYNRALTAGEVKEHYTGSMADHSGVWNGWIELEGITTGLDPYGMTLDTSTTPYHFEDWAWEGDGDPAGNKETEFGDWMLFDCASCAADATCGASYPNCSDPTHPDYKVKTSILFGGATGLGPNAPINIKCEGLTNPTGVTDQTPDLGAEYDDPDFGGTAFHWDKVDDEVFDDIATYVWTDSAIEEKDAYTLEDTSQTGNINQVRLIYRHRGCIKDYIRLGAVEEGSFTTCGGGDPSFAFATTTKSITRPGGGSWTWSDINNLQIGFGLYIYDAGGPFHTLIQGRISQAWVEVDYDSGTLILRPDGEGDYTNISGDPAGAGNWTSGEHWDKVDEEVFDGACTIVRSNVAGARDTFSLSDSGLPATTTINSIKIYWRALKMSDTENSFHLMIRSGGTDDTGGTITVSGNSWSNNATGYGSNPITWAPWTVAEVDALEVGAQIISGVQLSRIYVEVDYDGGSVNLYPDGAGTYTEFAEQYQCFGPSAPDTADYYQCQVIEDTGTWAAPLWDTTKTACGVTEGDRKEIIYGGANLALDGTKYYQRWKFWDQDNEEGPWSDGTDLWVMGGAGNTPPVAAIQSPLSGVQTSPVNLVGHFTDADGDLFNGFQWRDGDCDAGTLLYSSSTLQANNPTLPYSQALSDGDHDLYFKVLDDQGGWSACDLQSITIAVQCADGDDNDGDGQIDTNDPGCHTDYDPTNAGSYDPTDTDESDEPQCSNSVDDDGDGYIDSMDAGCHTDYDPTNAGSYDPTDDNENTCGTGICELGETYPTCPEDCPFIWIEF